MKLFMGSHIAKPLENQTIILMGLCCVQDCSVRYLHSTEHLDKELGLIRDAVASGCCGGLFSELAVSGAENSLGVAARPP